MFCRAALICTLSLYFVFGESASVFAEKLMASEDIQAVQQLLLQQGFDPGLLTGTISPATSKARVRVVWNGPVQITAQSSGNFTIGRPSRGR